MAYHNDSRLPLGANLRDKNEYLRTTHRYASSLRIPDDTSWPKIPERRLHENILNNTKAPCIVSFAGKPQENRNNTVHLTHSQFMKPAPRKDGVERNNNIASARSSLQTSTKEQYTPTCMDSTVSKFRTTVKTPINSADMLQNNQNLSNEQTEKFDRTEVIDNDCTQKNCQSGAIKNKEIPNDQLDINKTITEIIKPPIIINQEINVSSEKLKNSQESVKFKVSSDCQNCPLSTNKDASYAIKNDNADFIKEDSASSNKSLCVSRKKQEYIEYQKREWMPGKLRSSELHVSDTTDSEAYSSDTTKAGQMQGFRDRRIRSSQKDMYSEIREFKDYERKCCYKMAQYPQKVNEIDACFCIRCQKSWPYKKFAAHHSEPQISSSVKSQRCSTAHGKSFRCCNKNFHRVASDSDCSALIHGIERRLESKDQRRLHCSPQKFDDFLSHPEVALKAQTRLENKILSYFKKKNSQVDINQDVHYDYQEAMGAPQIKKRKSDGEMHFSRVEANPADEFLNAITEPGVSNLLVQATKGALTTRIDAAACDDTINNSTPPLNLLHIYDKNPQGEKQADNRLFKLKTAVFCGCILYVLILSLPTLYDYFFYEEEYDNYEDLTYVELILDYIVSSFQEAFGGLFDLISKMFFQSRTCRKCNNVN